MKSWARLARAVLVAAVVLVAAACEVRTEISVDVADDGSGTVAIGLGLDDDALAQVPNIEAELRLDDLTANGWTVAGPDREADGRTWLRVSKPFGNPDEAAQVFTEIAGPTGPFRDFRVEVDRSFARTSYSFAGTVDFSGGLEAFGDDDLAAALEGEPLGEDVTAIEERIGQTIDEAFTFRVAVRLPGDVSSNAPGQATNGAVWEPRISESRVIELRATSEVTRTRTLVLAGVAVAAGVGIVVVGIVVLVRRRSAGSRGPRHAAT